MTTAAHQIAMILSENPSPKVIIYRLDISGEVLATDYEPDSRHYKSGVTVLCQLKDIVNPRQLANWVKNGTTAKNLPILLKNKLPS